MIEPTSPSPIQPTHSSSKLPLILIGLLLILAAGVGGVYLGKYLYGSNPPAGGPAETKATPTGTPPATPTIDPTAGWKTYIDKQSEFLIKYPDSYFKYQGNQSLVPAALFVSTSAPQGGNSPKFLGTDDLWLEAQVLPGANLKSLDEYLNLPGQQIYPSNAIKMKTIIAGESAYKIDYAFPVAAGNVTSYTKTGIILKNEKIYNVSLSSWNKRILDQNDTLFDQILTTFRFTE